MARYPLSQPVRVSTTVKGINGILADPGTLTLTILKPDGTQQSYSSPARDGTGLYHQDVPVTDLGITGNYLYEWISTGTAAGEASGDFDVYDPFAEAENTAYCTLEEMKARLSITDSADDFLIEGAVLAASRSVDEICGRYFWRGTDTRTYVPESIYEQQFDDIVSVTTFKVDFDGDGVYEQTWVQGTDYALTVSPGQYNAAAKGESWPYTGIAVIGTGKFLPFVWPLSHRDRIQITGVFGWPSVPLAVKQAALLQSAAIFKRKDAVYGIAGFGELGVVRVQADPLVMSLLSRYITGSRVGV